MIEKIIIVDDDLDSRNKVRNILGSSNYSIVGEACDGFDAVEICRKSIPDLVIMEINLPLLDGISAARMIQNEMSAGAIVLMTSSNDFDALEKSVGVGALGYITKPLDEKTLLAVIKIALSKGKEFKAIQQELFLAKEKLEMRKKIEKAKGLLMKKYNITEEEAYTRIRNLSMNKGYSMKKISEIIILSHK